jgi:hypothetical protein
VTRSRNRISCPPDTSCEVRTSATTREGGAHASSEQHFTQTSVENGPQGKKLGRIVHGHPATTNLAFGGDDWQTLYFTSRSHLGAVNLKVAGIPVPTRKK